MDSRRVSRIKGWRWAAGLAVLAAGSVALFENVRARRENASPHAGSPPGAEPDGAATTAGYETADANVRTLIVIMAVAVGLMVTGVGAVFAMYAAFGRDDRAGDARLTAEQRAPIVPPGPKLQANPDQDLAAFLAARRQALTTYGWSGPDRKQAHIPIERAMVLVVGKPMDADAEASSPPAGEPR